MKIFNRITDFVARVRLERLEAERAKQAADIEYIAMMTDVDLDTEEDDKDER